MKKAQVLMNAVFCLSFSVSIAKSETSDVGPVGGSGGGAFRTTCESGDAVVGFDIQTKNVITRIAPVCGDRKNAGTYGRPWVGSEVSGATIHKLRCNPGSVLTILHVFWDKTPLVSKLGFTCYNPRNKNSNNQESDSIGEVISDKKLICKGGFIGVGIFGQAGTAIDALGLTCGDAIPPPSK